MFSIKMATESSGIENQDRALARRYDDGLIIAVADGAGGMGGGMKAAECSIDFINELSISGSHFSTPYIWRQILRELDQFVFADLEAGETTIIIGAIKNGMICGASVGDSEVWDVYEEKYNNLTAQQFRKPLIGSNEAIPVPFGLTEINDTLLFATDGLFKYSNPQKILRTIKTSEIDICANALIDSVRLPSKALQDDIALVIFRRSR